MYSSLNIKKCEEENNGIVHTTNQQLSFYMKRTVVHSLDSVLSWLDGRTRWLARRRRHGANDDDR